MERFCAWDRSFPTFFSDADGALRLWHVDDRRPVATVPSAHAPQGGVLSVCVMTDGRAVSHGRDGRVRTWQLTTDPPALEPLLTIDAGSLGFCGAIVVEGAPAAVLGSNHPTAVAAIPDRDATGLALWCLDTGTRLAAVTQPPDAKSRGMVCAAAWVTGDADSSPPRLVAGFEDGSLTLWSLAPGPPALLSAVRMHGDAVMAVALVPGRGGAPATIAAAGADATLSFTRLATATTLVPGPALKLPTAGVAALAVRPDGALLAAGCWDGCIRLVGVDSATPTPLAQLAHHEAPVAALAFDGGSGVLASGGRDGSIALWGVYVGE